MSCCSRLTGVYDSTKHQLSARSKSTVIGGFFYIFFAKCFQSAHVLFIMLYKVVLTF